MTSDKNTKITGFNDDYLYELFNEDLDYIFNNNMLLNNTVGKVINTNTNDVTCEEITPMVMLINQSKKGFINKLRTYIDGSDRRYSDEFNKEINYYGRTTSAREIAENYRGY